MEVMLTFLGSFAIIGGTVYTLAKLKYQDEKEKRLEESANTVLLASTMEGVPNDIRKAIKESYSAEFLGRRVLEIANKHGVATPKEIESVRR